MPSITVRRTHTRRDYYEQRARRLARLLHLGLWAGGKARLLRHRGGVAGDPEGRENRAALQRGHQHPGVEVCGERRVEHAHGHQRPAGRGGIRNPGPGHRCQGGGGDRTGGSRDGPERGGGRGRGSNHTGHPGGQKRRCGGPGCHRRGHRKDGSRDCTDRRTDCQGAGRERGQRGPGFCCQRGGGRRESPGERHGGGGERIRCGPGCRRCRGSPGGSRSCAEEGGGRGGICGRRGAGGPGRHHGSGHRYYQGGGGPAERPGRGPGCR